MGPEDRGGDEAGRQANQSPDHAASRCTTEGLNLHVKRVKRCRHRIRSFENYRLRGLLHVGGVTRPTRPRPPRIRIRSPLSVA